MTRDPYLDPRSGVLRNLLGIDDADRLAKAERELTYFTEYRLGRQRLPGRYDLDHLRAFHREIFGTIYPWAGEVRTVAIARSAYFAMPEYIAPSAARLLDALAAEGWLTGLDFHSFVRRLAHYLGEINAIHPFREGNGRAQRAFLTQLARDAGWRLRWDRMDPDENIRASAHSMRGDTGPLMRMLAGLIQPATIWPPFEAAVPAPPPDGAGPV